MGWGYGGTVVRFLLVSICPQQKAGLLGGGWRALGLCESCQGDPRPCSELIHLLNGNVKTQQTFLLMILMMRYSGAANSRPHGNGFCLQRSYWRESRLSLSALHSLWSSQVPLHLMNSEPRKTAQHRHPGKWGWVALGEASSKNKNGQCLLEQKPGVGKKCPVSAMGHSKGHVPHLLHEVGNATDRANIPNSKSLNLKCSKT